MIATSKEANELFFVCLHMADKAWSELHAMRVLFALDHPDELSARREMFFYWSNLAEDYAVIVNRLEVLEDTSHD